MTWLAALKDRSAPVMVAGREPPEQRSIMSAPTTNPAMSLLPSAVRG